MFITVPADCRADLIWSHTDDLTRMISFDFILFVYPKDGIFDILFSVKWFKIALSAQIETPANKNLKSLN